MDEKAAPKVVLRMYSESMKSSSSSGGFSQSVDGSGEVFGITAELTILTTVAESIDTRNLPTYFK